MKIVLMIFTMSVAAIVSDFYIFRKLRRIRRKPVSWDRFFLALAIVLDLLVVAALAVYRYAMDFTDGAALKAVMWVVGLFFLFTIPKVLYVVFSFADDLRLRNRCGRRWLTAIGGVLAVVAALTMLDGLTFGRTRIRVETVELGFENLPTSFDGMRVLQFSDLHTCTLMGRDRFLTRLVDTINALRPDVVVNTGDIVNSHSFELDAGALEILGRISAPEGVFSVPGNHDLGMYIRDIKKFTPEENFRVLGLKHEELGWDLLVNKTRWIRRGQDSIAVSGLNYPSGHLHNSSNPGLAGEDFPATYGMIPSKDVFDVTLVHTPALWDELLEYFPVDLALAGHVHAMQIKFRLGRRYWSPAKFLYERWSGLYEKDGRYLYVNDGLGYVMYPMRIGTRPEVTLFILRSTAKNARQ